MKKIAISLLIFLLVGCATSSGVIPMGPDTYMASKQAGSGFSGAGTLKADVIREAGEFCTKNGKYLNVVNTSEAAPPYLWGNYPRAEVQFMCLDRGDSELTRPKLTPVSAK